MTRIVVNIPHEELPQPELAVRVDLCDVGYKRRLVVELDGAFASEHKLCDFLEGGYALAPNGQLFDANAGPLRMAKAFSEAIECTVHEGGRRVEGDPQHLEFALGLFGGCKGVTLSLGEGAREEMDRLQAAYESQPDLSLFAGDLFPHQLDALRWIRRRFAKDVGHMLIADEPGVGKTHEAIAYICTLFAERPYSLVLVVCPASVIGHWERSFRELAPSLSVGVVTGSQKQRAKMIEELHCQVLLTSAGCARRDVGSYSEYRLDLLVIDEVHAAKGHSSKFRTAMRRMRASKKLGLSGSPMPNTVREMHAVIECLNSTHYLGSLRAFNRNFTRAIEENDDEIAAEVLGWLIGPCVLRRLKGEVLDLPEKTEVEVSLELPDDQLRVYREYEEGLRERVRGMSSEQYENERMAIIGEITHLRQLAVCPDAVLPDYRGRAVKVEATVDLALESMKDGHDKVVVFTLFVKSVVPTIVGAFAEAGVPCDVLVGDTPVYERDEVIARFNSRKTGRRVLVMSRAGGEGITLTGADVEVIVSPYWHHSMTVQSADRLHRISQTRDVTVYHLVCEETIEKRMLEIRDRKMESSSLVMKGGTTPLTKMSRVEMLRLLGG